MTNEEKAKEIAENSRQYFYHDEYECGLACALRMAKWKDEALKEILDERIEHSTGYRAEAFMDLYNQLFKN